MCDGRVTAHAVEPAGRVHETTRRSERDQADLVGRRRVAAHAVLHDDVPVGGRDLDRLVEVLEREALRVPVAMLRLGQVLGEDRAVRDVAVVAGGARVVMFGLWWPRSAMRAWRDMPALASSVAQV